MVHSEANASPGPVERPTRMLPVHPLPVEIIRVILRLAAATSPATEVLQWLCLCRAAHFWTAPILYANVCIRSMYHLHLFHDALEHHPIRGRWVKALWVSRAKQTPDPSLACPPQPSLRASRYGHSRTRSLSTSTGSTLSTAPTRRSAWTRHPSFPLLSNDTARDPTFDLVHILQHCPDLRHLALVGCSLLASALQVAAYPFRLRTLLLDPPICLKFRCMAHLSALQVLRIVGIPAEKTKSWREWCGEVRSLQRLQTLELVIEGPNERRVVSIDRLAIDNEPAPALATSWLMKEERDRETESPSQDSADTASEMTFGASGDSSFYQRWTTDRADEIAAWCLDF